MIENTDWREFRELLRAIPNGHGEHLMKSVYAFILYAVLALVVAWAFVHFEAHHYLISH